MSDHWYSMRDLPLGRVHVRVVWNARVFPAVRALHPKTRRMTWCEYRGGDIVWLPPPPKKTRDGIIEWSAEPERWQPLDRGKWGQPLPEPLPVQVVPQMTYMQSRFDALSAAELAREMEEDREAARASPELDQEAPSGSRWWRDITSIKYEPPGQVTKRMAEGRVLRALSACGRWQGLTLKTATTGSILTRMAEIADAEAKKYEEKRRLEMGKVPLPFEALPADETDFPIAMAWFTALNPPEAWTDRREPWGFDRVQRIMHMRTLTFPLSWVVIGLSFENKSRGIRPLSGTRVRQLYDRGIEGCLRVANGGRAREDIPVLDQIEALRERNRAHRRRV